MDHPVDRKDWPIRVYRLGEEPPDDLRATTTAAERLAMVWELTLDAWELAGREIPNYPREEAPIRIVPFLGRETLIQNKKASGRLKDLADLESLEDEPGSRRD
jgi:hypothetical protein